MASYCKRVDERFLLVLSCLSFFLSFILPLSPCHLPLLCVTHARIHLQQAELSSSVSTLEAELTTQGKKTGSLAHELTTLSSRVSSYDTKFDLLEISVNEVGNRLHQVSRDNDEFKQQLAREIRGRVETMEHEVNLVKNAQKDLTSRVEKNECALFFVCHFPSELLWQFSDNKLAAIKEHLADSLESRVAEMKSVFSRERFEEMTSCA